MENNIYDVAIIGAGPAGLTAGIYAVRAGLKTCIFEKLIPGGQICLTDKIENYPGFESISGAELGANMGEQAQNLGAEIFYGEVTSLELNKKIKKIITQEGTFFSKTVILTMGAHARKLELVNEEALIGRGVSYCATCDGAFYKGADVVVVGGGNTALEDALYLSGFANKVYLVHRRDIFRGEEALVNQVLKAKDKIEILFNSNVVELVANEKLKQVKVKNTLTNKISTIDVQGIFVAIGRSPDTAILENQVLLNDAKYIDVNQNGETNIEGVFAAGDVTNNTLKQVVTATATGAVAGNSARIYLEKLK